MLTKIVISERNQPQQNYWSDIRLTTKTNDQLSKNKYDLKDINKF